MSKNARYAWRLSLGGLLLGLLACAVYLLAVPLGFKYGEIQVGHGLEHEGRIAWDAAGVPHIRAQNLEDGYFLLGYSHARDRLWQMEFARRYAGGTLSEVFGAKTLPMDRFARTLGFRRTAEGIYANLDAPTRVLLQRYSDGINAYLERAPAALPLEFSLMRHERPGPWGPVDSLSLHLLYSWTLSANLGMQLQRLALAEHLDLARINEVFAPYPGERPPATRDYASLYRSLRGTPDAGKLLGQLPGSNVEGIGSNNWVVSASRSATGKPLLANDPHLRLTNPAAFYLASLKIPGLSLTGANFAGAPLFVIGHNQRIAWGYTNTGSHIQDAYLERVDPQDPRRYLTPDGYRPFETRLERIAVRDGEPVSLEVRSTRHGPVISDIYEPARLPQAQRDRLVIALAWTGLDHHDKTFPSLLAINRAEGWEQFLDAAADFGVPPQNMVYADVEGNIGYVSAGRVPLRGADDDLHGLAPSPGWESRYDWVGYVPESAKPRSLNPREGFIATANQRIVPPDNAFDFGHDWVLPYRYDRIREWLGGPGQRTLEDSLELQNDEFSSVMASLLPKMLEQVSDPELRASEAFALLQGWNHQAAADLAAPLIAGYWVRAFTRELLQPRIGTQLLASGWNQRNYDGFLRLILDGQADLRFWCGQEQGCDLKLNQSLRRALDELRAAHGSAPDGWKWGEAHAALAEHVPFHKTPLRTLFDLKNNKGGDNFSVNVGRFDYSDPANPFNTRIAATLRMVIDLADFDNSRYALSTRNSGLPFDGATDLNELWARGAYIRIADDAPDATDRQLVLRPSASSSGEPRP
ncbi:TPA: penicillin acylase family protein [Pseudomonas aeruginosa]|uniref:penicillin acylase family protein n=1 Tax=Pseudomonas aeruginosa TaxID=287 RepID=UPI0021E14CC9|nr:penicillin acylase family protein [Pseudomonas aeruginosa]MCV0143188.1 penicillin acylase family protein [Pseudomonas aeruginosa]MCV0348357.1 penicillin acylase family protein [Pseudomonas aeruginosa]MDY1020996.1 penicillin acylase family protein [Pseudomonas aeruginosa]HBO3948162.1 penicillin acylase family protein [Pseudomonas aeruginosa]HCF5877328.1 penicillin acylase family protein [Pseudomonas aeruginosa]